LRVLKYLYLTKNFKLTYYKNDTAEILDSFVDADWAGDTVDNKSTTGYVIRLEMLFSENQRNKVA